MKIRTGFVSNSSTSSFCIYGIYVSSLNDLRDQMPGLTPELKEIIAKGPVEGPGSMGIRAIKELLSLTGDALEDAINDGALRDVVDLFGLEVYQPDDSYYIGRSWDRIGDDETGGQFKVRVKSEVAKLFGAVAASAATTHEEAYQN